MYQPISGFDNNSNRRPYSAYSGNSIFGPSGGSSGSSNSLNKNNNQLSSSSSTSALTAPYHDHDPVLYPYRPAFSSADRLVTSKPSYYNNRPSFNFYRPTTYKPILSQTTLSLSLDSESYPLYPGDVIKFGSAANSIRPLKPYNPINNYYTSSPPTPPHPPPQPLPPLPPANPPLTTQHPYDPLHTNDIYTDHDRFYNKFDNKYGSNSNSNSNSNNNGVSSSGSKISSISPKGN